MASGLFNLPPRATKASDTLVAQKASKSIKQVAAGVTIKGGGGLLERIAAINAMTEKYLGKYRDKYLVIRDADEFVNYIDTAIKNNIIAIDTETTGLNPITDKLAGICIYTPGMKSAYVPMHHISYVLGTEVDNQLQDDIVAKQLQRLADAKTDIDMFNAKFDTRVIKNQLGVKLTATWDAYIGARLLNENEGDGNNGLKPLHDKYCMNGKGESFSFGDLFKGIPFTYIPIKTAYLYAAGDPIKTFELCEFQRQFLDVNSPICKERDLERVAWLFKNIEMPLIPIVADMEDNGICFDTEFAAKLSKKYNEQLKEKEAKFYEICGRYQSQIDTYKAKTPNHKLSDPISINSPTQLAILLYDILNIPVVDKKTPRGTGEDILTRIDNPICKAVLEYREVAKLLSTYVDKMGNEVNPKTGKIHCNFNQIGADTGRFSSSNPNMQNIPSHNKEIRQMFTASPGHVLLSSDYSAQEPRITAHLCQDPKMIKAYIDGKDLYAEMASLAFNYPYEECLEFRPDGTKNADGKERRNKAKAIFLGIVYGKGVKAIGEDLKVSTQKAQEIYDSVLKEFPALRQFMADNEYNAKTYGFVETIWGRKRRLPNIQLPPYEFTYIGGAPKDFDPLFDDEEDFDNGPPTVDEKTIQKYTRQLDRTYSRTEKEAIKARAKAEGILIKDNGGYIAEATRQCTNARVQGSAADLTKLAMLEVANDKRLNELGFKLLLPVHDELIGECPEENAKEVAERFSYLMVAAAKDLCVPSKCDVEISRAWYGESLEF